MEIVASGRGGGGGIFDRSTGRYSVSRSTGTRPAARINRSSSAGSELRGGRSGVVVDLLLRHRAVHIVGAEPQRDLRDPWRKHHPVRLDVIEIIKQQARHRDGLQIEEARRSAGAPVPYFRDETPAG